MALPVADPEVVGRALEAARAILRPALAGRARLSLFGSFARGEAHRGSDIDIAVDPIEPLDPSLLAGLREQLEESHIPYRVDLVDLSACGPEFRARVLSEAVPWTA